MVQKKQAFTLVELIVTIVILAILWAIAFISFQGYSRNTRDSARVSDLNSLEKSLAIFMTKTWFYPDPDNSKTITYEGASAWIEWTISENVIKNLQSVSKKPIDPLTSDEFTYSVTNSKTEYQIWTITEIALFWYNFINKSVALDISKAKAYIKWTYNEKLLKIQTWAIQKIIAQPSIIVTDIWWSLDLSNLINNKKIVYKNYDNLPHSYNHNISMTGWFDYIPWKTDIVVYSWTTINLDSDEDKIEFLTNIKNIFSWTILDDWNNYNDILKIDPTDNTWAILLVDNYIRNKVWWVVWTVSDIKLWWSWWWESDVCSLTQAEVDALNLYTDGYLWVFDENNDEIVAYKKYTELLTNIIFKKANAGTVPSPVTLTEEQWCNDVKYIQWHQWAELPNELWELINLKWIDLSMNSFSSIPAEIVSLKNLEVLNLNENEFVDFPNEILWLKNLKDINLWINYLTSIPTNIWTLTNLESLDLGFNSLTTIPDEITTLTNLKNLDLQSNQLTSLPTNIWDLTNLELLFITENPVNSLPSDLFNLTKLIYLDMTWIWLTTISSDIWKLTNLTSLGLSYNSLTTLPTEITNLTKLKYLHLDNNSSLWNLSEYFHEGSVNHSQSWIPTIWKTMTIWWNWTNIVISVSP